MATDAQEVAIAALLFASFVMLPYFIVVTHRDSYNLVMTRSKNSELVRIFRWIILHIRIFHLGGFGLYGATSAAITVYWHFGSFDEAEISRKLYLGTIGTFIGFIIVQAASAFECFHGINSGSSKILSVFSIATAGFLTGSVWWSVGNVSGDAPGELVFVGIVFSLQLLWSFYYCYIAWKYHDERCGIDETLTGQDSLLNL